MSNVKARIKALAERLQALYPRCNTPYEQLDPLSQAVIDVVNELLALDEQGKAALLDELNRDGASMSMGNLEQMIRSITVNY